MADLIHLGWCDVVGDFNLVPLLIPVEEIAERLKNVEMLNEVETARETSDEWFLMAGAITCPRPCADCAEAVKTELHHWMFDANDEETADEGEDVYPDGRMVCKHCDAWRTVLNSDE